MPVNKHIGKLWFDTQEEIDAYDDLMVSNIELKDPNFESPHFTILSLRDRKERVPQLTDKALSQINDYNQYIQTAKAKKTSFATLWERPFYKHIVGIGLGYLLIRELPVRNFYARAFIMFFYLNHLRQILTPDFMNGGFAFNVVLRDHPGFRFANQQTV